MYYNWLHELASVSHTCIHMYDLRHLLIEKEIFLQIVSSISICVTVTNNWSIWSFYCCLLTLKRRRTSWIMWCFLAAAAVFFSDTLSKTLILVFFFFLYFYFLLCESPGCGFWILINLFSVSLCLCLCLSVSLFVYVCMCVFSSNSFNSLISLDF